MLRQLGGEGARRNRKQLEEGVVWPPVPMRPGGRCTVHTATFGCMFMPLFCGHGYPDPQRQEKALETRVQLPSQGIPEGCLFL